ncbi:hypothetical protein Gocc_2893 [Gaiella occulta]|uniref:Uncharacterized protein n=1 Tax=Gaiella occulta TaxID=1002870 RepID=A0A7M2YT02_9ACTN|nr:hypothetical protein [Gaiella occulta]RDI73293.1 hypothetical protein Gocc_2893 [Gaiella occulta]
MNARAGLRLGAGEYGRLLGLDIDQVVARLDGRSGLGAAEEAPSGAAAPATDTPVYVSEKERR